MSGYAALPGHQDDVAQLAGPQVALHLAEGEVGVGQGGEHAVLGAGARLHGHAGGQRGAAVGRSEPAHTQTGRQGVLMLILVSLVTKETDVRTGSSASCSFLFPLCPFPRTNSPISSIFRPGLLYSMSLEADKSPLMVQLLGVNGQINLAHLKEKLPIK